jgi:twinkle protein
MSVQMLRPDEIDFEAYSRETEAKRKVRSASLYVQELIETLGKKHEQPRAFLPWAKTHKLIQLRPGEVTLWPGVNGHGKSLVTGMVAASLITQGERVCVASFEMKPRKTLERMVRQWCGDTPDEEWDGNAEAIAAYRDTYEQFGAWAEKRLWLYDQQGTVQRDVLIGVIRYCAKELRITHFFLDSLMKCVAGEDDYNGQKELVDELTAIARDYGMHIHLVHHIRKLSSEEQTPDKTDVKGTGAITDLVDNLILVWRNKRKEKDMAARKPVSQDEPDALLICEKQRNGEWEGRIQLWFHKPSHQFIAHPGGEAMTLYTWPHAGD